MPTGLLCAICERSHKGSPATSPAVPARLSKPPRIINTRSVLRRPEGQPGAGALLVACLRQAKHGGIFSIQACSGFALTAPFLHVSVFLVNWGGILAYEKWALDIAVTATHDLQASPRSPSFHPRTPCIHAEDWWQHEPTITEGFTVTGLQACSGAALPGPAGLRHPRRRHSRPGVR